jgi:hypothetical protein
MVWRSWNLDVWWLEIHTTVRWIVLHVVSSIRPVCVRRTPKKTYNLEYLVPTVKHGARSVVIWAAISWYSAGSIIFLIGRITAGDYVDVIGILWSRGCFIKMLQFFKMTFRPYIARSVQSWVAEHGDTFQHLTQPAQSPALNIIEPLWAVLERMVRSRFPPLSLRQLEEERYSIPLEGIQSVCENIPRKTQAVLEANGGPPPYL